MSVCTSSLKDFNSFPEDAVSAEADADFGQAAFLPRACRKRGQRRVRVDVSEWLAVILPAMKTSKGFDQLFEGLYRN
jgi:hypothetical protein